MENLLSIIVPVRYRADLTEVCLDSLIKYTSVPYEIIVVHEGTDHDIESLLRKYPVTVVNHPTPKGYAGALNAGMKVSKGNFYCFMNNDTVATPNWITHVMKVFEDPEVGVVSPTFWGTGEIQSVDWNQGKEMEYVNDPTFLAAVCFVVRKEAMDLLGEWDEQFFHGCEDIDFNIRMNQTPYRYAIARKSFIYHYGAASTRELVGNTAGAARAHYLEKITLVEKKHGIDIKSRFNILK